MLLPERVFTVEASITAKPFFARHGFTVIKQQEVEARGERFVNYRMRRSNRLHSHIVIYDLPVKQLAGVYASTVSSLRAHPLV
jgi:hypothetical protein